MAAASVASADNPEQRTSALARNFGHVLGGKVLAVEVEIGEAMTADVEADDLAVRDLVPVCDTLPSHRAQGSVRA
jgi:hypothetical protein